MPISNAAAQRTYQEARDALSAIVGSRKASQQEKASARRERDALDADFIGKNLADLAARTALFQRFADKMEAVTTRLETNSLVSAVGRMRSITKKADDLLEG